MKHIELRRHSTKTSAGNSVLSESGKQLALEIGKTHLTEREFSGFFVSPLSRTSETLQAFKQGADDFKNIDPEVFPPHLEVSEKDDAMSLWEGPCHSAETSEKDMLLACFEHEPEATEEVARKSAESFKVLGNFPAREF